jgi:hypothetical protein
VTFLVRHRLLVLIASVVVAVAFEVLPAGNLRWLRFVLILGLMIWSFQLIRSFRPARLEVLPDEPAFRTAVVPGTILAVAAYTVFVVGLTSSYLDDGDGFALVVMPIWAGILFFFWRAALGWAGVWLRPDGILDRQVFGTYFVPWEALALPRPAYAYRRDMVQLDIARPDLVRRRGVRQGGRSVLPAPGVEAELLARAIHEYANRPELRPMIGSVEEWDRFRALPPIAAL